MDAPKRIWTDWESANDACVAFDEPPASDAEGFSTEYILATEHTRLMVEKDAEIAELEEALEAARRDAFEEAAKVAEPIIQKWVDFEPPYDGSLDDAIDLIQGLPAAIRALAEKG